MYIEKQRNKPPQLKFNHYNDLQPIEFAENRFLKNRINHRRRFTIHDNEEKINVEEDFIQTQRRNNENQRNQRRMELEELSKKTKSITSRRINRLMKQNAKRKLKH